jgi:hypothetical protein
MSRQTVTAQLPCRSLSRQPRKLKAASFGHLMGQERLFSLVQKRAQELVEEIAALPPLPKQIYEMGDAASELAKHREHRSTWGVLTISCSPVTSATCAATRSVKVSPACRTASRESPSSSGIDARGCPIPASGGLNQR